MPFGDFTTFCETVPLPLCASVGAIKSVSNGVGIEANCYARNIEMANTIIFQMAASAIHIVALVMTVIMILHVRGKFTAVGMSPRPRFYILAGDVLWVWAPQRQCSIGVVLEVHGRPWQRMDVTNWIWAVHWLTIFI